MPAVAPLPTRTAPPDGVRRAIRLHRDSERWPDARRSLVEQHLPLVWAVARRCDRIGAPDLIGPGVLALVAIFDGFDCDRPEKFASCAVPRIRGAMLDAARADRLRVGSQGRSGTDALLWAVAAGDSCTVDRDRLLFLVAHALTLRQAAVIRLRFGLEGEGAHRQEEVGRRLGLSQAGVAKAQAAALRRLRRALEDSGEVG